MKPRLKHPLSDPLPDPDLTLRVEPFTLPKGTDQELIPMAELMLAAEVSEDDVSKAAKKWGEDVPPDYDGMLETDA